MPHKLGKIGKMKTKKHNYLFEAHQQYLKKSRFLKQKP